MPTTKETRKSNRLTWGVFLFLSLAVTGTLVYLIQRSTTNAVSVHLNQLEAQNKLYSGALLKTSKGDIEIDFYASKAPRTVNNFIQLAQEDFYDGTRFHRVIEGFMIQGGDPLTKDLSNKKKWGTGGPGYTFDDEINDIQLTRGKVAMANSGPDTNGSQFFILTTQKAPWLEGKHTVFANVVGGMEVVNIIESTPTDGRDIPKESVVVHDVVLK